MQYLKTWFFSALLGIASVAVLSPEARAFSKRRATCTEVGYRQRLHGLEPLPTVLGVSIAASALLGARGARDPNDPESLSGQQIGILAIGAAMLAYDLTSPKYPCEYDPSSPASGGKGALENLDRDAARTFRRHARQRGLYGLALNSAATGTIALITDRDSHRGKIAIVGALPILYTAFRFLTFREEDSGNTARTSLEPTLFPREDFSFKNTRLTFDPGIVLKWRF